MRDFTVIALQPEKGPGVFVAAVFEGELDSVDDADTTPGFRRLAETITADSALEAEIVFLLDHSAIGLEERFPDELQPHDAHVDDDGVVRIIDTTEDLGDDFLLHFEDGSVVEVDTRTEVRSVSLFRDRKVAAAVK